MSRSASIVCALAAWLVCSWPCSSRAFSDVEVFAQPALEGGGAGRYFSGSPRDPHGCSVCHAGGRAPEISITGLPERLSPDERHEVSIRWQDARVSHALHLELATKAGAHAGLELPDLESLPARQRCEQREDGEPAVFAVDVGPRRVLGVHDCGASELRFAFTVPDDAPELFFSLGVVRSDGEGTPEGDGVYELRRKLTRHAPEPGGCSAAPFSRPARVAPAALLLLALLSRRLLRVCCAGLCLLCGCFQATDEPPPRDAGSALVEEFDAILHPRAGDAAAADCPEPRVAQSRELQFRVRTVSAEGRYRPRNVGAIWIEDAQGTWVKTLEQWGTRRAKWLTAFHAAAGGDITDAITGATLSMHRVHEVSWDLTDGAGCEVADGDYQLRIELTDWSGAGPNATLPFEKGDEDLELNPEDQPPFLEMRLRLE